MADTWTGVIEQLLFYFFESLQLAFSVRVRKGSDKLQRASGGA